jgi:DEAD/DEAH box helicase domain-containing protein
VAHSEWEDHFLATASNPARKAPICAKWAGWDPHAMTQTNLFEIAPREIFFDIETLRLSHEVEGGWSNIARFGLAVAITWDAQNRFRRWFEQDAKALISELEQFDRIVSFNGDRFDFEVLRGYHPVDRLMGKSFDLLVDLTRRLGHRVKLDDLARETLVKQKTGDGLEIVQWWREGRKEEVCKYCENDVQLLVDLMEFARKKKYVVVKSRQLPVDWP